MFCLPPCGTLAVMKKGIVGSGGGGGGGELGVYGVAAGRAHVQGCERPLRTKRAMGERERERDKEKGGGGG